MRIGIALLLLGMLLPVSAQTEAARLEVRAGRVEVLRADTVEWLRVSVGSVMPFGEGDRVRTGESSRVGLIFPDDGELLLLSAGEFALERYEHPAGVPAGDVIFRGRVSGIMVQRWTATHVDYHLTLDDADTFLTSPAHAAVWSLPESPDSVAVAAGTAEVQVGDKTLTVAGGEVAWLEAPIQSVPLTGTLTSARAQAVLFGCPAIVQTIGNTGVLVRRGIGQFNERLGLIPDGAPVAAMAINDAGYWIRIQYLSGFSWVVRDALAIDCPDLPRLPDQTPPERLLSITAATQDEIALLRPFFGLPAENPFFYLQP